MMHYNAAIILFFQFNIGKGEHTIVAPPCRANAVKKISFRFRLVVGVKTLEEFVKEFVS